MHYLNYISIAALAFIFYKLITDKRGRPAGARHIEPCLVCGAPGQLKEDFLDSHVQCSNIYCAMAGPLGCCEVEAISAWNNLPSMSAIVAWQFQDAGAALALQRLMSAALHMRAAQKAYEQYGSNEDSVAEAEAIFDGLLEDIRKSTLGPNHE